MFYNVPKSNNTLIIFYSFINVKLNESCHFNAKKCKDTRVILMKRIELRVTVMLKLQPLSWNINAVCTLP